MHIAVRYCSHVGYYSGFFTRRQERGLPWVYFICGANFKLHPTIHQNHRPKLPNEAQTFSLPPVLTNASQQQLIVPCTV